MGLGTKKQLHDAVIKLDEHEQAMINNNENPAHWFWLCVSGVLITLVWIGVLVWAD